MKKKVWNQNAKMKKNVIKVQEEVEEILGVMICIRVMMTVVMKKITVKRNANIKKFKSVEEGNPNTSVIIIMMNVIPMLFRER